MVYFLCFLSILAEKEEALVSILHRFTIQRHSSDSSDIVSLFMLSDMIFLSKNNVCSYCIKHPLSFNGPFLIYHLCFTQNKKWIMWQGATTWASWSYLLLTTINAMSFFKLEKKTLLQFSRSKSIVFISLFHTDLKLSAWVTHLMRKSPKGNVWL